MRPTKATKSVLAAMFVRRNCPGVDGVCGHRHRVNELKRILSCNDLLRHVKDYVIAAMNLMFLCPTSSCPPHSALHATANKREYGNVHYHVWLIFPLAS